MEQVESSFKLIGILNRECAVRPPGKRSAAIPEEAIARAICLSKRIFASRTLYTQIIKYMVK